MRAKARSKNTPTAKKKPRSGMAALCVVVNPNVLLSGVADPASVPGKIIAAWRYHGSIEVLLSASILEELRRVPLRYARWATQAERFGGIYKAGAARSARSGNRDSGSITDGPGCFSRATR